MAHVHLLGIECKCRVGVPDEERRRPQRIELDLGLLGSATGKSYVDYARAYLLARAAAEGRSFKLVEEMAEAVAKALLKEFKPLKRVFVAVHKWPKIMPGVEVVAELEVAR